MQVALEMPWKPEPSSSLLPDSPTLPIPHHRATPSSCMALSTGIPGYECFPVSVLIERGVGSVSHGTGKSWLQQMPAGPGVTEVGDFSLG